MNDFTAIATAAGLLSLEGLAGSDDERAPRFPCLPSATQVREPYRQNGQTVTNRAATLKGVERSDQRDGNWAAWLERLNSVAAIETGWDGYDAEAPSQFAVSQAKAFLEELHAADLPPIRLSPSAVGGVAITHRRGRRGTFVEFYNDGTIFLMMEEGEKEPVIRPVRPDARAVAATVSELRAFLDA